MTFGQATLEAMQYAMRRGPLGDRGRRGHQLGRQFRSVPRPDRPLRRHTGDRHADLRVVDRCAVRRSRGGRPRGRCVDELRRVHARCDGRDRQSGFEVPLHVRWPDVGTDRVTGIRRHQGVVGEPSTRRASKGLFCTHPGHQGRRSLQRQRCQRPPARRDRRPRPGRVPRAQEDHRPARGRDRGRPGGAARPRRCGARGAPM